MASKLDRELLQSARAERDVAWAELASLRAERDSLHSQLREEIRLVRELADEDDCPCANPWSVVETRKRGRAEGLREAADRFQATLDSKEGEGRS